MSLLDLISILDATLRVATPLILAALAGLFSERAGIVDIGLEGKMLAAAFLAASVAVWARSPWAGLVAGMGISFALAMVHGLASVTYRGNQMVSGMAINIVASGLTPILATAWFQQAGRTPILEEESRFLPVLFGHNILVLATPIVTLGVAFLVARTRFGLRLRAVGENPHALDTAGISVAGMRYRALALNGLLCGAGGAYLSTAQGAGFVQDMTAGKGFLALVALIFGKWRPWPAFAACLLFAFADAIQVRMQGVPIPGIGQIPVQAVQAAPYILTVLLLAGFVGRAVAPKAIGIPYVKSR